MGHSSSFGSQPGELALEPLDLRRLHRVGDLQRSVVQLDLPQPLLGLLQPLEGAVPLRGVDRLEPGREVHPDVLLGGLLVAVGAAVAARALEPLFDAGVAEEVAALEAGDPVLAGVGPLVHADRAAGALVVVLGLLLGEGDLLLWGRSLGLALLPGAFDNFVWN